MDERFGQYDDAGLRAVGPEEGGIEQSICGGFMGERIDMPTIRYFTAACGGFAVGAE